MENETINRERTPATAGQIAFAIVCVLIVVGLVVIAYFFLSDKGEEDSEANAEKTAWQESLESASADEVANTYFTLEGGEYELYHLALRDAPECRYREDGTRDERIEGCVTPSGNTFLFTEKYIQDNTERLSEHINEAQQRKGGPPLNDWIEIEDALDEREDYYLIVRFAYETDPAT